MGYTGSQSLSLNTFINIVAVLVSCHFLQTVYQWKRIPTSSKCENQHMWNLFTSLSFAWAPGSAIGKSKKDVSGTTGGASRWEVHPERGRNATGHQVFLSRHQQSPGGRYDSFPSVGQRPQRSSSSASLQPLSLLLDNLVFIRSIWTQGFVGCGAIMVRSWFCWCGCGCRI